MWVAHAQTGAVEPELQKGQPGNLQANARRRGDVHAQAGDPELRCHQPKQFAPMQTGVNKKRGRRSGPNMNAHVHLEKRGAKSWCGLWKTVGCWRRPPGRMRASQRTSMFKSSCKTLGSATLPWPGENTFLTLPPPPSPITQEAARMQHSPAVNAEMPPIPEPEDSADLEPQPHDTPPPNEAVVRRPSARADPSPYQSRRTVGVV